MATLRRLWSPEEITDMQRQLAAGASLREVGELYGVTGERVRQLAGNVNRHHPPGWKPVTNGRHEKNRRRVSVLAQAAIPDRVITDKTGLSPGYVTRLRLESGIRYKYVQSPEHSLRCLAQWVEEFDYVPAATDWNPASARSRGQLGRAQRFYDFRERHGCPYLTTVRDQFGSWNEFIRQGGYEPRGIGGRQVPWQST